MATDEPLTFGILLTRYRAALGLTQEELAERAGLSVRGLRDLERGVKTRPRAYTVRQLADALALLPVDRATFELAARGTDAAARTEDTLPVGNFLGAVPPDVLVGREEELERLRVVLAAVAEGSGQLLLLGGELGVGKTRLLQEIMVEARERGYLVLIGRCYSAEQCIPFYPFLEAVAVSSARVPARLRSDWYRGWKGAKSLFAIHPGVAGREPSAAISPPDVFGAVTDLFLLAARSTPVALLLDDVHWSDAESLKLLQHLARTTRSAPILLAATFRDVRISEEYPQLATALQTLGRERLAERIAVRRFSSEETTRLVSVTMGRQEVSEEFATFVHRRTKGNPRLIDQLVRSLGGRLELQAEIGAGSMGHVFRAFDRTTQRVVAAKLVLARSEIGLDAVLRFQQEGAVLAQLDHPHIVHIYDTFVEEHASCIIMELLEGQSLGEILREGPLPLPRARAMALQVAQALAYAHGHEIVHRDIKPDNVMVVEGDQVQVTDFGIARILPPDTSLQSMATTGMRMGTPLYMAPEQIEGKKIDGRADIYALGAMLYHMVTGRPPFEGNDALAVAVKHLQQEPVPPSHVNPLIPADWDAAILKAMAKDPLRRFQSAREVAAAIAALGEQARSQVPVVRRLRWIVALPATLALALAVVTGVFVHAAAGPHHSQLRSSIDDYLSALATRGQFSGTVLVGRKGNVVLVKGYGLADRKKKVANGQSTRYPVGGVSYSMTLAAGLKLEEQGELHDRDLVCSYLTSCPTSWQPITVGMLLDGTSGLPDYDWGIPGNTTTQSLADCQRLPLTRSPGAKGPHKACTLLVLGTIMQKATGEPWATVMRKLVLEPAGMHESGRISDGFRPPALAQDYSGSRQQPREFYDDYFQIYSSASDVYRYDNALFGGKLLTERSLERLFSPRDPVDPPDSGIVGARWGDKWKRGTAFGHQVIYTTGGTNSFTTIDMQFPAKDITIIVVSNDDQNDAEGIAVHIAGMLFGATGASHASLLPPAVDPAKAIVARIKTPVGFGIGAGDGALWVPGPPGSGSVARVDPMTNRVVAAIKVTDPSKMAPGEPAITWVAVGDGQVWVTDRVHDAVARIDPATNRVQVRIPLGIRPFGLTIEGDTLWADNSYENPGIVRNALVRVDLRSEKVVATITNSETHIGQPYPELHATPQALWFPDLAAGAIKRLDPASNKIVTSIQTGPQPTSVAVGDGAVWVSSRFSNLVARLDPATNRVAATVPLEGYPPSLVFGIDCCFSAIAAGAGGVWTIAGPGNRTLVRIDPQTDEATAALTFPQSLGALAVADGSVWVGDGGQLDRINPTAMTVS